MLGCDWPCFYCDSVCAEVTLWCTVGSRSAGSSRQRQSRTSRIMSGYSREVLLATSVLCGAGGAVQARELHRKLLQHCDVSKEEFDFIMQRCPRFLLVPDPAGGGGVRLEDCTVIARTSLRLCGRYGREKGAGAGREECTGAGAGAGDCQDLHLCKFFIYGNCRFGKGR